MPGNGPARILTPGVGYRLYLWSHFACLIGLPFLLARYYLRGMTGLEGLVLLVISPQFLGEVVFFYVQTLPLSGHFLIFLSAIPGLKLNRWIWLYIAIVLTSSIKIIFLLFLILPSILGNSTTDT